MTLEGVIGKQDEDVENDIGESLLGFGAENGFKVPRYQHLSMSAWRYICTLEKEGG